MWLPRDARRILSALTRTLRVGEKTAFNIHSFEKALRGGRTIPEYGYEPEEPATNSFAELKIAINKVIHFDKRSEAANELLVNRGLIIVEHHQSELNVIIVTLTTEGQKLGTEYLGWLTWIRLWLHEHPIGQLLRWSIKPLGAS
ncbi:MAG TPA: hypothetical protein VG097_10385 [Gemmata sp.]|jgi:hypothetical protein|nr:hypothetical protein [Gemmata sp.]